MHMVKLVFALSMLKSLDVTESNFSPLIPYFGVLPRDTFSLIVIGGKHLHSLHTLSAHDHTPELSNLGSQARAGTFGGWRDPPAVRFTRSSRPIDMSLKYMSRMRPQLDSWACTCPPAKILTWYVTKLSVLVTWQFRNSWTLNLSEGNQGVASTS